MRAILFSLLLIVPLFAIRAEEPLPNVGRIVLTATVSPQFEPKEVIFFIRLEDQKNYRRSYGTIIPIFTETKDKGSVEYLAGVPINLPPDTKSLEFSVLLMGGDGRSYVLPGAELRVTPDGIESLTSQLLRERLFAQKKTLSGMEAQLSLDRDNHDRLLADAEVISRLERVREVFRETELLKARASAVEKDIERSSRLLKSARSISPPRNYNARRAELNNQIRELTELHSDLQRQIANKGQGWEMEFQTHIQMIEETRNDDIELLESELKQLQSYRFSFEQSRNPAFGQEYAP